MRHSYITKISNQLRGHQVPLGGLHLENLQEPIGPYLKIKNKPKIVNAPDGLNQVLFFEEGVRIRFLAEKSPIAEAEPRKKTW